MINIEIKNYILFRKQVEIKEKLEEEERHSHIRYVTFIYNMNRYIPKY